MRDALQKQICCFNHTVISYLVKTLGLLYTHFLGCTSCISVTKKCHQISFLESPLKSCFFSYISLLSFFRRPIWLHSWLFYCKPCNQGTLQRQMCKTRNNKSHEFIGFLKWDTKEESFSTTLCSNCKHSTENMVKVTQNSLQTAVSSHHIGTVVSSCHSCMPVVYVTHSKLQGRLPISFWIKV